MTSLPGMTHDPSAPPPLLLDSPYASPDYGNLSLLPSLPAANVSSGKLYQVPVGFIVLLSIFYGIISLVAVAGNFMVMWIVATSRRMQTVTNFFIANLAVADIIIGLFSIPFQFQAALLQRWVLPEFMCAFCPFVQVLSVNVSIFTLTAIALDRYRAVMSPLKARTTKLRAKFIICGIWTLAVAAALPCALALRVETQVESHALNLTKPFCHEVGISRKAWRIYNHVLVCLQYFFPLLTICFVYARMGLKLKESKSPGNAQGARDAGILKNKKKVIKMLFVIVALFAFCWLPYQLYNVLREVFPKIDKYKYINIIWFCTHWLAMSNSCYNPFIYAIYNIIPRKRSRMRSEGEL
ncbi:RYamide receptor isoform X2 [Rhipicephalus sanguineus]|uniref:RYamide receptor isoform X2 n=1 Tax=Rhipicephalus sanguineus TaxID=34632 RepID=UPI0020C38B6C|nr:RYamide receptor isoform X2 [Rhipicephalus sanguineus]